MNCMQREGRERGVHWFYVHSKPRSPLLEAKSTPEDARSGCEGDTRWRVRHEVASAETNQRRAAGADGGSRRGDVEREEAAANTNHCVLTFFSFFFWTFSSLSDFLWFRCSVLLVN